MELWARDRIVIRGHHVGEPDRDCEVREVRGPNAGRHTGFAGAQRAPKPLLSRSRRERRALRTHRNPSVKGPRKVLSLQNGFARRAIREPARFIQRKDFQCSSPVA
jgi:hypothetical protein